MPLPYDIRALEPHMDAETVALHHGKHHQAYVNNANKLLENYPEWNNKSADEILTHLHKVPEEIRTGIRNHVGGVSNHDFFWKILSSHGGEIPKNELQLAIEKSFGSFELFKTQFSEASLKLFGSGWAWLVLENEQLKILSLPNQDSPLSQGLERLLCIDVWEHAYYLKYQNRRADYINAFWNLVDWDIVERIYTKSLS